MWSPWAHSNVNTTTDGTQLEQVPFHGERLILPLEGGQVLALVQFGLIKWPTFHETHRAADELKRLFQSGRQGRDDKGVHQFAGPEAQTIR
jgi:hypothetical protein